MIEAFVGLNRTAELADAYVEAWQRGKTWREALTASRNILDASARCALSEGLEGGAARLGLDLKTLGLTAHD